MSRQCTTHHHACDCREEKFKQTEAENKRLREGIERITESDNPYNVAWSLLNKATGNSNNKST